MSAPSTFASPEVYRRYILMDLERIRLENETLYAVINTVSSSLDLRRVLDGIVDIATEATACHACFVYFVEGERLVLRAASPVYRGFVGKLSMSIDDGITGWVARHRTPEFIREGLLNDERVHYVPELEEERFQSMVAVPVPARSGEVLGVIVLHTAAPREFEEGVLNFLVHTASLVAGAIENAQLYGDARRRVDALTTLAALSQRIATVTAREDVYRAVVAGARGLLAADAAFVYRLHAERNELELAAADPAGEQPVLPAGEGTALLIESFRRKGSLAAPLVASDEHLGLLCAVSRGPRVFTAEEEGLFRAVADQAAVALKKSELIERLTAENLVKDIFDALAGGAPDVAAAKATTTGWDLDRPHLFLHVAPVSAELEPQLRSLLPNALLDARPDHVRALVAVPRTGGGGRVDELHRLCGEVAARMEVIVGIGGVSHGPKESARGLREAADAARIGRALRRSAQAVRYDELGAYRYLVHVDLEAAPQDRYRDAVEVLLDYDLRRGTGLLDTLEQYLRDGRSVVASARALYIHPNTVRQRLERIETLSTLRVRDADLLSLELAIKLVRLDRAAR